MQRICPLRHETTATLVDQYAAFIHATADDVVNKALHYLFSKDRDFQDYLKSSDARRVTPTLRVRRSAPYLRRRRPTPYRGPKQGWTGQDNGISQNREIVIIPPEASGEKRTVLRTGCISTLHPCEESRLEPCRSRVWDRTDYTRFGSLGRCTFENKEPTLAGICQIPALGTER